MQKTLKKEHIQLSIAFVCFMIGLAAGGGIVLYRQGQDVPRALRESNFSTARSEYEFIDPLIGTSGVSSGSRYLGIKNQIASYVAAQKDKGLIIATVNFRDINGTGGFVVNPDEQYTPASLNKVPVMMAYFQLSETEPSILTDRILYAGVDDNTKVQDIRSAVTLKPGTSYTVDQLIEHMIRYSDNNAVDLLLKHLQDTKHTGAYVNVFSNLGIDPNVLTEYTDNLTAQQYSIFLRALYNATYLSRANSERALMLMSETDFTQGIESGVPNSVRVSQKFGEVRMTDTDGNQVGKEIHNCGIVYYPKHPYLLCIMTKAAGNDIPALEQNIADISRLIYADMEKRYP